MENSLDAPKGIMRAMGISLIIWFFILLAAIPIQCQNLIQDSLVNIKVEFIKPTDSTIQKITTYQYKSGKSTDINDLELVDSLWLGREVQIYNRSVFVKDSLLTEYFGIYNRLMGLNSYLNQAKPKLEELIKSKKE